MRERGRVRKWESVGVADCESGRAVEGESGRECESGSLGGWESARERD